MKRLGSLYKRKDRKGYWLRWTDPLTKKRVNKQFNTMAEGEHFRHNLYVRLNADVYDGQRTILLGEAIKLFLKSYDRKGLTKASKDEATRAVNQLLNFYGNVQTSTLTQTHFDNMLDERKNSGISLATYNKEIRYFKTFLNFCKNSHNRFLSPDIYVEAVRYTPAPKNALALDSVRLWITQADTLDWKLRILLALTCDLRKIDILSLRKSDIDFEAGMIIKQAQKTGKIVRAPIHQDLEKMLAEHCKNCEDELFVQKAKKGFAIPWQKLRVTNKTLLQTIGNIPSLKSLLGHSDYRTSWTYYSDQDLINRWRVNQLPVKSWLKKPSKIKQPSNK